MTRTEERLTNALEARASQVRENALRPLRVPAVPLRRRRIYIGLASAVSVLAAVGLAAGLVNALHRSPALIADVAKAGSPPPYYAYVSLNDAVVVRSSAGQHHITDIIPPPPLGNGCGTQSDCAIAAAADGRLFVVGVVGETNGPGRTYLYSFSITASGKATRYRRIPGRPIPGLVELQVAVSPDGSRVAVAGVGSQGDPSNGPPKLFVINTRTGQRSDWHARLPRPVSDYSIPSVWWSGAGSQLDFVLTRCRAGRDAPLDVGCSSGAASHSQIWSVVTLPPGTDIGGSRRIGNLPDNVVQSVPGPGIRDVTIMIVGHGRVLVRAISLATGRLVRNLYSAHARPSLWFAQLTEDGTGRYLIIDLDHSPRFGWLHDGRIVPFGGCRDCLGGESLADYAAW